MVTPTVGTLVGTTVGVVGRMVGVVGATEGVVGDRVGCQGWKAWGLSQVTHRFGIQEVASILSLGQLAKWPAAPERG
jgi:hypothetical protein